MCSRSRAVGGWAIWACGSIEALERRRLLSLAVPALSSLPGAPSNLYLDFDGDISPYGATRPAYNIEGKDNSFSSRELLAIRQTWSRVADAYSPFNVNVTTVAPPPDQDVPGKTLHVVIGGHTDRFIAGESQVGAFNDVENRSYVYDEYPGPLSSVIDHEAGHGFGLWHQSDAMDEYRNFPGDVGAIMSASYNPRVLWWKGYSQNTGGVQDDMAVLAQTLGYRPDDYPNQPAKGSPLSIVKGSTEIQGIISNDRDLDWFSVNWPGGPITVVMRGSQFANTLDARLEIRNASGSKLLAWGDDPSVGQILHATLTAGTYRIGVMSGTHLDDGAPTHYGEAGQYRLNVFAGTTDGQLPFNDTAPVINSANPTTIQWEDYDAGGEGIAYHESADDTYSDSVYRGGEGPDISWANDEGFVSYGAGADAGEWTEYTVGVAAAGKYRFAFRSQNDDVGGTFHVELDGKDISGEITVPATGTSGIYKTTILPSELTLPAGQHVLRFCVDSGGADFNELGNIDWFQFIPTSAGGQTFYPASMFQVSSSTPSILQTEDYDRGGQGVSYNDTTRTNSGGVFRSFEGVDLLPTTDAGSGYRISDAMRGEWLEYSVEVAETGIYDLAVRAGSPGAGGSFHIDVDGQTLGASIAVPNTGSYDTMQDVNVGGLTLSASKHLIRLAFDSNSPTSGTAGAFNWIRFTPVALPTLAISIPDSYAVMDSNKENPGVFRITRSGSTSSDLWIRFQVGGTAVSNGEYAGIGQAALIPAGKAYVNVTVQPYGAQSPGDKTVSLSLLASVDYLRTKSRAGTLTLHNALPPNPDHISGTVFNDTSGDGERDTFEAGIAGRTVYLDLNDDGVFQKSEPSAITDQNGAYLFDHLFPGDYVVRQVLPKRWSQTSPVDGNSYQYDLTYNSRADDADFGSHQV